MMRISFGYGSRYSWYAVTVVFHLPAVNKIIGAVPVYSQDYEQALRITPRSPDVYYNRGLAYFYKQDYDKAIADYTQALLLNPRYSNAYHNRAIAYYMKKEYQKALADIQRMQHLEFKIDDKLLKALRDKVTAE